MVPSLASRSVRFAILAWPRSRSSSNAFSRSPPASVRADLASIIPTPASCLSFWMSLAPNSAILSGLRLGLRATFTGDGDRGRGRLLLEVRYRFVDRGLEVFCVVDAVALGRLGAGHPSPLDGGVGDGACDEVGGADGVVVPGDHVIHPIGIAVRIHESDNGHPEAGRLGHRRGLGVDVDDEDSVRSLLQIDHPAQVLLQL